MSIARTTLAVIGLIAACVLSGCATPGRSIEATAVSASADAPPAAPAPAVAQVAHQQPIAAPAGSLWGSPVVDTLAGPHSVDEYAHYALLQNPEIQAAQSKVAALAYQVPQAASLQDPHVGVVYLPEEIQTAAGEQRFQVSVKQQLPWPGKLQTKACAAEAETNRARAELSAKQLEIVEQVKRAYFELYYQQQAIAVVRQERKLVENLAAIAEKRLGTGDVSQQDVLRAQLEASRLDSDLVALRQMRDVAQHRLATLLHVAPQTDLQTEAALPQRDVPGDLQQLTARAVAGRPELHAQLAALERDRYRVDLACLQYRPDVTASLAWLPTATDGISPVTNGRDPWLLGVSMNVPLYRARLDAGVNQAESQLTHTRQQYETLRDRTEQTTVDLFVQVRSRQELLDLFDQDLLPKAEQTLQVSLRAYEVGDVDFLQLIDNWRQVLRIELSRLRSEVELHQALASLDRVVGGHLAAMSNADVATRLPSVTN